MCDMMLLRMLLFAHMSMISKCTAVLKISPISSGLNVLLNDDAKPEYCTKASIKGRDK